MAYISISRNYPGKVGEMQNFPSSNHCESIHIKLKAEFHSLCSKLRKKNTKSAEYNNKNPEYFCVWSSRDYFKQTLVNSSCIYSDFFFKKLEVCGFLTVGNLRTYTPFPTLSHCKSSPWTM